MLKNCYCQRGLFQLAKDLKASEVLSRIIAFQPPDQVMYKIEPINYVGSYKINKSKHSNRFEKVKFVHDVFLTSMYKWIEEDCYIFKKHGKNKKNNLIILHLKHLHKTPDRFAILFSHGNASTLGTIYPILFDLSTQFKCDIISYDYSGYGRSQGRPSESEIYSDIEEVGFFVKEILGISVNRLILMGQSIGSAPSVHLAITQGYKEVLAVILLSPIASGIKLVSPDVEIKDLENIDLFCNLKKITDVQCPFFLIHGQRDEVIPIKQSMEMAKFMKNPFVWTPRNGDHYNILTQHRTKFLQKCKFFFDYLSQFAKRENNFLSSTFIQTDEKLYKSYFRQEASDMNMEENYVSSIPNSNNFQALSLIQKESHNLNENDNQEVFPNRTLCSIKNDQSKNFFQSVACNKQNSNYPFDSKEVGDQTTNCNLSKQEESSFARESIDNSLSQNNKELEQEYNDILKKHKGI